MPASEFPDVPEHTKMWAREEIYWSFVALNYYLPSLDDYKRIFETIWKDRASSAGWDLDVTYSPDLEATLEFSRMK